MNPSIKVCKRCVMDDTMPGTEFDNRGVCNNCLEFDQRAPHVWFPNEIGAEKLRRSISEIKRKGKHSEYDCLLGLSGGVDSSYLAVKVKEWGLRPLVFHVDAGWNSELAVANIASVVKHCQFDLFTEVVDWETMKDLQLAYFRSGVLNQDVPQDHVFFASLFKFAKKFRIKSIISGHNFATESVPMRWQHSAMDRINLFSIHNRFGKRAITGYQTISFFDYYVYMPIVLNIKFYSPLNLLPYDREAAIAELEGFGWRRYGRKHGESLFTKFFQDIYLPRKHGIDKRKAHLSSMIHSGFISRNDALRELERSTVEGTNVDQEIAFFIKKLGITEAEFNSIMSQRPMSHLEFRNWNFLRSAFRPLKRLSQAIRLR